MREAADHDILPTELVMLVSLIWCRLRRRSRCAAIHMTPSGPFLDNIDVA